MCSLAMIQALRAISSIIRALEKSLLVEMWNSMKKAHEIGAPKNKRSMISFLYLKREIKGTKFTKSLSPPPSPAASPIHESPSSSSLLEGSSSERPRKMRSLQDLYDSKEIIDGVTLFCLFANCEPPRFEKAVRDKKWRDAMDEEIKAIKKNDTQELATLPTRKKSTGVKWVYKLKKNAKGEVERYKARLVVKGCSR